MYETELETEELKNALEDLPDNFLACRDWRHAWDIEQNFYVARDVNVEKGDIRRELICIRCGMIRTERYRIGKFETLVKVGQTYHAPEGYLLTDVPRGNKPAAVIQAVQYQRAKEQVAAMYAQNNR